MESAYSPSCQYQRPFSTDSTWTARHTKYNMVTGLEARDSACVNWSSRDIKSTSTWRMWVSTIMDEFGFLLLAHWIKVILLWTYSYTYTYTYSHHYLLYVHLNSSIMLLHHNSFDTLHVLLWVFLTHTKNHGSLCTSKLVSKFDQPLQKPETLHFYTCTQVVAVSYFWLCWSSVSFSVLLFSFSSSLNDINAVTYTLFD